MCFPGPSKSHLFPNILDKAPALLFRFHCNLDMSFPNRPLQSPFTITPPFPFNMMRPLRPAFLHGHHLLKNTKNPVTKGRGSRGTTFINRINDSLGTYGKGTVSPFDTLLLITERTIPASPTVRFSEAIQKPIRRQKGIGSHQPPTLLNPCSDTYLLFLNIV